MRKVVSVLLSAAMALSLCAGCSSSSSDTADTKAAEEKGADAADTEAGEAAEGVMPAVAKEDLKVGVIHIGNPADGSGYSYTHDQGIVAMQKAVGLEDDQIIRKNNVADDDQTASRQQCASVSRKDARLSSRQAGATWMHARHWQKNIRTLSSPMQPATNPTV